jgi:hypothetical protein
MDSLFSFSAYIVFVTNQLLCGHLINTLGVLTIEHTCNYRDMLALNFNLAFLFIIFCSLLECPKEFMNSKTDRNLILFSDLS